MLTTKAKKNTWVEPLAGFLTLFFAFLLIASFGIWGKGAESGYYHIHAIFKDVGDLQVRSPVLVAGFPVGNVVRIDLDQDLLQVRVEFLIEKRIEIPTDTVARIVTRGLSGGTVISLSIGAEEEILGEGGMIEIAEDSLNFIEKIGRRLLRP